MNKSIVLTGIVASLVLAGCGGGGGSSDSGPVFRVGQFPAETQFKDLCETPRTGNDPFNNNRPYPDRQGSLEEEKFYLRSFNDRTYLWYDEVVDRDPADFSTPVEYFDVLKTNELTPSGNPKDDFHFATDTFSYRQQNQTGVSAGYGAEFALLSSSPPRRLVFTYTVPNTSAASAGVARGAELVAVNGVDFVNDNTQAGVDTLNAALFPSAVGQSNTFVIRDRGSQTTREITLVSQEVNEDPVLLTDVISTASGDVGYVVFNSFNQVSRESLFNAFTALESANVTDLVLDLRYNGGGSSAIASELSYMIAGDTNTNGRTFNQFITNDKLPFGEQSAQPFYSSTQGSFGSVSAGTSLPSLDLDRVYVLSTAGTCSASELVMNALNGIDIEVVLIGGTTCGKPYGFIPQDNCGTTYFTIQFQSGNERGFGAYSDGFSPANTAGTVGVVLPGCSVADDYSAALGDPTEDLLQTALSYRQSGTCPTPTGPAVTAEKQGVDEDGLAVFQSERIRQLQAIKQNLFYDQQ